MDPIAMSSIQFAVTAMFHIVFPTLTIGLASYLVWVEFLWVKNRHAADYRQARFWGRIFALSFAVGVVSGVPLEFEFGTNFAPFSIAAGDLFGHVLGFETAMAFMLEAGFLGVMLFGWKRVHPSMHFAATLLVWFGATLSAFWILSGNSWMQTPRGVEFIEGKFVITDWLSAIFTPSFPTRFSHVYIACLETGLFFLGGLSAWFLLHERHVDFFRRSFKAALAGAILIAPLQVAVGDASGLVAAKYQPAKLAAMEAHWNTNRQGTGAPWAVLAIPDQQNARNRWEIGISNGLSWLITRSPHGVVTGLNEFAPQDQPRVWVVFYAFRVMLAIGFFLAGLALVSAWRWWKGGLFDSAWIMRGWVASVPLGFVAVETGWITAEVGRQPWIVYGFLRTRDALSPLPDGVVLATGLAFGGIYLGLLAAFAYYLMRILQHGPDMDDPLPQWEP